ncbi:MAG: glycosyltransferase family 4 protein [Prevotella sp.]|nr:glycosyltransferase family 4 protein [Prevotella sp.]
MNNITFLAQFPPPMHGLSKAVETLYGSNINEKYGFSKIDIANNKAIVRILWKLFFTKADIVYFTIAQTKGGNWRDLLFLKIIALRRKKCIVHLHGGYYRIMLDEKMGNMQRRLNVNAMKGIDAAIVLGNSLQWIFEGLIPEERIFTVKNCIDNQFCIKDIDAKIRNIAVAEKIHVLYLSNFIASKGYPELLKVAEEICNRGRQADFVFHFAGRFFDAREEKAFDDFVANHHLGETVVFHGPVYGDAKVELLEQCHVFSLLTTYPNEGQPISILEAMGNGMAVITTDHAGIPDIATSDNGCVCPKGSIDIRTIAYYLEKCYDERVYLQDIARRNHTAVMTEFTEQAYIENMDKIFEKVCKK